MQHIIMERLIPGAAWTPVVGKVITAALVAPMNISLTFTFLGALKGHSAEVIEKKVRLDLGSTWATGIMYWPAVMLLNFRFVPLQHRATAGSAFGTLWHIYLSKQANKVVGVDDIRVGEITALTVAS
jgi:protein Mpv17